MPRELNFNEVTEELLEEGWRMMYEEELSIGEDDFINGYQTFTIN